MEEADLTTLTWSRSSSSSALLMPWAESVNSFRSCAIWRRFSNTSPVVQTSSTCHNTKLQSNQQPS